MKKNNSTKKIINDLESQLKRVLADYQNQKKRFENQQADFIKFSNSALLDKFLSVLDDLERAQLHLKDEGLNLAIKHFNSVLDSEDVKEIACKNSSFDPKTADCVELIDGSKNKIIEVIKKGYTLNGKVLRPAQVRVGKGK